MINIVVKYQKIKKLTAGVGRGIQTKILLVTKPTHTSPLQRDPDLYHVRDSVCGNLNLALAAAQSPHTRLEHSHVSFAAVIRQGRVFSLQTL